MQRIEKERQARHEVGEIIRRFVEHRSTYAYEWDDFLHSRFRFRQLEAIRKLCLLLDETHPPTAPKEYCDEEGIRILQTLAERLLQS